VTPVHSIKIETIDGKIWNQEIVYIEIAKAMSRQISFCLDFNAEGPDIRALGLYDLLEDLADFYKFNTQNITIKTANALEYSDKFKVIYQPVIHLLSTGLWQHARDRDGTTIKKQSGLKTAGIFIGRSNAPRLYLSACINDRWPSDVIQTFHYNANDDFHRHNIGLEDLQRQYAVKDLTLFAKFLSSCPRLLSDRYITIDKSLLLTPAQQLLVGDQELFLSGYRDFFVEIVCETYFSGNTFFISEKTYRPMILKTPFIIQGPRYYLRRLKELGFRTFDRWWDEGHDEDDTGVQIHAILDIIERLQSLSSHQLLDLYNDMHEVLEHNYQTAMSLSQIDLVRWRQLNVK